MAEVAKNLGEIQGLCACYSKNTLNGRGYDRIYQRLLSGQDYRFNEMMRRGGILCEFGHPDQYTADFERTETNPENACALITEITEGDNGKVYAKGIILDTPAGRTYKAISPFYKFGFSSRGSYEADESGAAEGPNGWNQDTYVFKGFDIVALPANEGSEISAVESIGRSRKKKRLSARESLDLQNIADAANVDPKEVDAELDKLFAKDGSIAPAEFVDVREFSEGKEAKGTAGNDQNNLLLDVQKLSSDKAELEQQVQKLLFAKSESDAAIISLKSQVAELNKTLRNAQSQLEFYIQNKKEIEQLINKLIQTHESSLAEADTALTAEKETSKSLAAQVASLQQELSDAKDEASVLYDQANKEASTAKELDIAKEQISKLRTSLETLKSRYSASQEELASAKEQIQEQKSKVSDAITKAEAYRKTAVAAKESLMDTYSQIYSIDRRALSLKVGKSGDVKLIKSAAESLSKDALRFSTYQSPSPVKTVSSNSTQASYQQLDDVDKEMFEALKREGKV